MILKEFMPKAQLVPFMDGGRDWGGWDCWGLVCTAYRDILNIHLEPYGEISAHALLKVSRAMTHAASCEPWHQVTGIPQAYDVVVMRLANAPRIGHVGMMVSETDMMHVEMRTRGVRLSVKSPFIRDRIIKIMRHESCL